jgi:hypothetical protein
MQQNTFFTCPIDQLYESGLLDSGEGEGVPCIRYIAAKRLKQCDRTEFERVKKVFHHHQSLIEEILSSPVLPSSSDKWLPAFRDSLDCAAEFWGMEPERDQVENPSDRMKWLQEWKEFSERRKAERNE